MSNEITTKIIGVIAEQLDSDPEAVTKESRFSEDLKADSLAVAEILLQVEELFDVVFEDEDMDSIKTVQDAVDYIKGKIG